MQNPLISSYLLLIITILVCLDCQISFVYEWREIFVLNMWNVGGLDLKIADEHILYLQPFFILDFDIVTRKTFCDDKTCNAIISLQEDLVKKIISYLCKMRNGFCFYFYFFRERRHDAWFLGNEYLYICFLFFMFFFYFFISEFWLKWKMTKNDFLPMYLWRWSLKAGSAKKKGDTEFWIRSVPVLLFNNWEEYW